METLRRWFSTPRQAVITLVWAWLSLVALGVGLTFLVVVASLFL